MRGAELDAGGAGGEEGLCLRGDLGGGAAEGEAVWAVPYDYEGGCEQAPDICLGVPYFNWGPAYLELVQQVSAGEYEPSWDWNAPYWEDINDHDKSAVGFVYGNGLTDDEKAMLDEFIAGLAANAMGEEGGINLWVGPLTFQDETVFLAEGEVATEKQIWYQAANAETAATVDEITPHQLLYGLEGASE